MSNDAQLSPKATAILGMIAAGKSYEQILAANPGLTYLDIFNSAREALQPPADDPAARAHRLAIIRKRYPRSGEPWSGLEDQSLRQMISEGMTIELIAGRLQRPRSAIRRRIVNLDLIHLLSPMEQVRLRRNMPQEQWARD